MNRRGIFSISAITAVGLALLPGSTFAQQKSLKDQLVGTWTLVSCDSTDASGAKAPYCVNPIGILMLDAGGRFASVIAARGRPKSGDRVKAPAEVIKTASLGFAANFGTWSVNEADKTITTRYQGALTPDIEGADFKRPVNLVGDELKVVGSIPVVGGRAEAVYRRAK